MEKRCKTTEASLNEKLIKLEATEQQRTESDDKVTRLMAELETANATLSEAEQQVAKLTRTEGSNATAIADLKQSLEDETRAKLALQTRLRETEAERETAKDALDEEEQSKQALEKHVQMLQQQVRLLTLSCFIIESV